MVIRTFSPLGVIGLQKLLLCVCTGTDIKIDGLTVDVSTAAVIVGRYLALDDAGRARMRSIPINLAVSLARLGGWRYAASSRLD